jgi:hypothetical protein
VPHYWQELFVNIGGAAVGVLLGQLAAAWYQRRRDRNDRDRRVGVIKQALSAGLYTNLLALKKMQQVFESTGQPASIRFYTAHFRLDAFSMVDALGTDYESLIHCQATVEYVNQRLDQIDEVASEFRLIHPKFDHDVTVPIYLQPYRDECDRHFRNVEQMLIRLITVVDAARLDSLEADVVRATIEGQPAG